MITPYQTVGPFFSIGFSSLYKNDLTWESGHSVRISGKIIDADGQTVPDACLEFWQADVNGEYHSDERLFARIPVGDNGSFELRTFKPGKTKTGEVVFAPHIQVCIFMRGLLYRLISRVYFDDEDNLGDPILASVPKDRINTLMARKIQEGQYQWNVALQGENETVFFD